MFPKPAKAGLLLVLGLVKTSLLPDGTRVSHRRPRRHPAPGDPGHPRGEARRARREGGAPGGGRAGDRGAVHRGDLGGGGAPSRAGPLPASPPGLRIGARVRARPPVGVPGGEREPPGPDPPRGRRTRAGGAGGPLRRGRRDRLAGGGPGGRREEGALPEPSPGPRRGPGPGGGIPHGGGREVRLAGGRVTPVTLRGDAGLPLEIRVLDERGRPAAGAELELDPSNAEDFAWGQGEVQRLGFFADREGRFRVPRLPAGLVRVYARLGLRRARGEAEAGGIDRAPARRGPLRPGARSACGPATSPGRRRTRSRSGRRRTP